MPMLIQTNVASLAAQKNLSRTQSTLQKSFERLSSGYRINTAADDAAGLAISESLRTQIRSYTVASRNTNDAISMAQTADGALGEMSNIFGRMRELAMQGSNGSMSTSDRGYLSTEFVSLQAELSRIQSATKFNGIMLIGSALNSTKFQIGINNVSNDQLSLTFGGLTLTKVLNNTSTLVSSSASHCLTALDNIDTAMATISLARSRFGAAMNRLEVTSSNLDTVKLNTSAAESRIRDVDVAEETSQMSRTQVLQQAGAAVLAQANQIPQVALTLLRG